MKLLTCLMRDTRGTSAVEYALVAALIAVAIAAAITQVGNDVSGSLEATAHKVSTATAG